MAKCEQISQPKYNLTLTEDEMAVLHVLLGSVGGEGELRDIVSELYIALDEFAHDDVETNLRKQMSGEFTAKGDF